MRRSSVRRRQCAIAPVTEEASSWWAPVATATAGGAPMKISRGVVRKPPPTPNIPDSTPTPPPIPSRRRALTDISAMGR